MRDKLSKNVKEKYRHNDVFAQKNDKKLKNHRSYGLKSCENLYEKTGVHDPKLPQPHARQTFTEFQRKVPSQ